MGPKSVSPAAPATAADRPFYWLGVPRPKWSLSMIGLCFFAFTVIGYYWPLGTLGIGVAAVGLVTQRSRLRIPAFIWLYALLVLWAAIGLLTSIDFAVSYDLITERLKLLAIMLIIVNTVDTERRFSFFVYFFLGCYMLFPARGAFVNFLVGQNVMGRLVWNNVYGNPNDLAALSLLALGTALAVLTAKSSLGIARFGAAVAAALLLVVIVMTKSRGVLIGLVVSMGPSVLRLLFTKASRTIYAVVALIVVLLFVPDATWDRYVGMGKLTSTDTLVEADPEGSAAERWEIQKSAWQIFLSNPITGVGLGNFATANLKNLPQLGLKDTHNTYLNLACELGLPGLVLWFTMAFSVLKRTRATRVNVGTSFIGVDYIWLERATLGFLVAGLFGTYWALTFPYLVIALLWCSTNPTMRSTQASEPVLKRRN